MIEDVSITMESVKQYFLVLFEKYGFAVTHTEYGMGQIAIIENSSIIIKILDDRGYIDIYIKSIQDKKYDFGEYDVILLCEYILNLSSSHKVKYPDLFRCISGFSIDKISFDQKVSFLNCEIDIILSLFSDEKILETKRVLDELVYKKNVYNFGERAAKGLKVSAEYNMKVELYRKNLPDQSSQE